MATPAPTFSPTARPTTHSPSASPAITIHADTAVLWQCGLALGFAILALLVWMAHVYSFAEDEPMYSIFGFMFLKKRKSKEFKGSGISSWDLSVIIAQALLLAAVLVLVLTPEGATPGVVSNLAAESTAAILGAIAIAIGGFASLADLLFITGISVYHGEYLTCGGLFEGWWS